MVPEKGFVSHMTLCNMTAGNGNHRQTAPVTGVYMLQAPTCAQAQPPDLVLQRRGPLSSPHVTQSSWSVSMHFSKSHEVTRRPNPVNILGGLKG